MAAMPKQSAITKLLAVAVFSVTLLAATLHAGPNDADPVRLQLASEVLDLSGTTRSLERLPSSLIERIKPDGLTMINPIILRAVRESIGSSFRRDRLRQTVLGYTASASAEQLTAINGMLRNPLALKFTAWEGEAGSPDSRSAFEQFLKDLRDMEPDRARMMILAKIDKATFATEAAQEHEMISYWVTAKTITATLPKEDRRTDEQLNQAAVDFRSRNVESAYRTAMIGMMFAYRKASTQELVDYCNLVESESGQVLAKALRDGYKAAIEQSIIDMNKDLAARLTAEAEKSSADNKTR